MGHDYTLTVSDLVGGETGTLSVSGAEPNTLTFLGYSLRGLGETFIEPLNVTVELEDPVPVGGPIVTDEKGNGSWILDIPQRGSGLTVWLQSVQDNKRSTIVEEYID